MLRLAYHQGDGSHLSLIQSVYFTIETFATVGFGDFSFAHQSTAMQVFGIALIVSGVTLSTVILALITNALVSRRIEQSLGQGAIHGMDGHVVLVGLGAVGLRVLEGLRREGRDVVVVERDESNRYVQHARGLGAPVVHGDATLGQTLRSVNLAKAGAVAILTSDDLVNLETGLAVRDGLAERWVEVPVVLRVFDRALGSRLQQTFHFNHVWSTGGARLALVRRRRPRPGDPRHLLRPQPALPRRPPRGARGRRPRRAWRCRSSAPASASSRSPAAASARPRVPAPPRHPPRRRRPRLPPRALRGAPPRPRPRTGRRRGLRSARRRPAGLRLSCRSRRGPRCRARPPRRRAASGAAGRAGRGPARGRRPR